MVTVSLQSNRNPNQDKRHPGKGAGKQDIQWDEGSEHHLKAGHEVLQVWEGIQTFGLKYTVLVQDIINKEIHIGNLQEAKGECAVI